MAMSRQRFHAKEKSIEKRASPHLGDVPLNLLVDALSNLDDPASDAGMAISAHRWEKQSQKIRGLAIRNYRYRGTLRHTVPRISPLFTHE
jgi:hypothetical protein